ncbi:FtsJ-like methyltransferase domain [Bifidobacterium bombi DSM 19703]|uniref:FtsJ-like methyltransferase domain n=1 Tax=Bifidobacterium bombi DSM 19703 TaxID=1341695 RepID=A0A080N254_9BIFI|nr:FtsJ-like methyltransferase domain [Bifidobacterium bombi DSM 19703]
MSWATNRAYGSAFVQSSEQSERYEPVWTSTGCGGDRDDAAGNCTDTGRNRERLDVALVRKGLASSRSKAQRLIREGRVLIGSLPVDKPSALVDERARLRLVEGEDYVSRGAYKLLGAFERFARLGLGSPEGRECLDIGASTGGFTDVLLRMGARRVVALDVGHGQLDPVIARDPRVVQMSGVNIRDVTVSDLPCPPELVVSDVSFISLTYVIPIIASVVAPHADVVLLVKPQFEVGRGNLGSGGIVENPELRMQALRKVCDCASAHGLRVVSTCDSPITGAHGNREYLLYASAPRDSKND